MNQRHITKAKTHVFKNDDLKQVLHAAADETENLFSKTKSEPYATRARPGERIAPLQRQTARAGAPALLPTHPVSHRSRHHRRPRLSVRGPAMRAARGGHHLRPYRPGGESAG
jgi:hypothetical protein